MIKKTISKKEYKLYLDEVYQLFNAKSGTKQYKRLMELIDLVEDFEKKNYPMK